MSKFTSLPENSMFGTTVNNHTSDNGSNDFVGSKLSGLEDNSSDVDSIQPSESSLEPLSFILIHEMHCKATHIA